MKNSGQRSQSPASTHAPRSRRCSCSTSRGKRRAPSRPSLMPPSRARQYPYMPRISVSVTMWSVSSHIACRRARRRVRSPGFCAKPCCENSITSPSSAETKPAGPNRLAWRSRRRCHLGRVVLEPEMRPDEIERVRARAAGCGASTASSPAAGGSRSGRASSSRRSARSTTARARRRGSGRRCSFMLCLKLDTPCVTPRAACPALRARDHARRGGNASSITSCDLLSARHRPNVTNHVCSRPG